MTPTRAEIAAYYDELCEQSRDDTANPRVLAAIAFVNRVVDLDGAMVLDVGCGVGLTTREFSRAGATVLGLDISPACINEANHAREVNDDRACSFTVADYARARIDDVFDVVAMIDVYEHFPREDRLLVHWQLRWNLRHGGSLVLTVPTPEALQLARANGIPLQPVDEDVTERDLVTLADDIGGSVEISRLVSISSPNDYRHVLIRRGQEKGTRRTEQAGRVVPGEAARPDSASARTGLGEHAPVRCLPEHPRTLEQPR